MDIDNTNLEYELKALRADIAGLVKHHESGPTLSDMQAELKTLQDQVKEVQQLYAKEPNFRASKQSTSQAMERQNGILSNIQ